MRLSELNAVVFDTETCNFSESTDGFDISNQKLTIAVTYDDIHRYRKWQESSVHELINYLLGFDKIVGFNIKEFDNKILDKYHPGAANKLNSKAIDMLEVIEKRLGHRVSLNSLVGPTLGLKKSGDGEVATKWAMEGNLDKVTEYCIQDVELTKKLFLYGLEKKEVHFDYHGQKRTIKIDWLNPDTSFSANEFMYVLADSETGGSLQLDATNSDFFRALELIRTSNKNLFITGKAGTGKTTFLKYVKSTIQKEIAIVAFTGVAAINAGGQTIHSFFKIDPTDAPFTPWDNRLRRIAPADDPDRTTIFSYFQYNAGRREILRAVEVLIIDEVSMLRADLLDVMDKILRAFSGRNRNLPFGGVQVVLIGDAFQLPPIEGDAWHILQEFYDSPFFFSANVFKETPLVQVELKKIYRQNEIDFINLLNRVRINEPLPGDINFLNSKVQPLLNQYFDEKYIVLCSTNPQVSQINGTRLRSLPGEGKIFTGEITGKFPETSRITDLNLTLKIGAQVMFLKNGPNYYNGKIGTIHSFANGEILVQVKYETGESYFVTVEQHTWKNVVFSYNNATRKIEQEVVGTFTQFPLKLAWAITVHKSQGMTFDKVFININSFAPSGLTYVALSRCRSLNGLALVTPITRDAIYTDPRVIEFAKKVTPDTLISEMIGNGKADEQYSLARKYIKDGKFHEAFESFVTATKFRNDIATENFKRYVVNLLFGRSMYKSMLDKLLKSNKDNIHALTESNQELAEKTILLKKITNELSITKQERDDVINSNKKNESALAKLSTEKDNQNTQLKKLKADLKKAELANIALEKRTVIAEIYAQSSRNTIAEQKQELSNLQQKLDETTRLLEFEKSENFRLKKMSWIKRLIGSK